MAIKNFFGSIFYFIFKFQNTHGQLFLLIYFMTKNKLFNNFLNIFQKCFKNINIPKNNK